MARAVVLVKGKKGRNIEKESAAGELCINEGHAGDGPALRLSVTGKKDGKERIVLIDDDAALREIINQCESVLCSRESVRKGMRPMELQPSGDR